MTPDKIPKMYAARHFNKARRSEKLPSRNCIGQISVVKTHPIRLALIPTAKSFQSDLEFADN